MSHTEVQGSPTEVIQYCHMQCEWSHLYFWMYWKKTLWVIKEILRSGLMQPTILKMIIWLYDREMFIRYALKKKKEKENETRISYCLQWTESSDLYVGSRAAKGGKDGLSSIQLQKARLCWSAALNWQAQASVQTMLKGTINSVNYSLLAKKTGIFYFAFRFSPK